MALMYQFYSQKTPQHSILHHFSFYPQQLMYHTHAVVSGHNPP